MYINQLSAGQALPTQAASIAPNGASTCSYGASGGGLDQLFAQTLAVQQSLMSQMIGMMSEMLSMVSGLMQGGGNTASKSASWSDVAQSALGLIGGWFGGDDTSTTTADSGGFFGDLLSGVGSLFGGGDSGFLSGIGSFFGF